MHNKHRGEISARLDGRDYRLCLSLGALAELETAFAVDDMLAVVENHERLLPFQETLETIQRRYVS